MHLCVLSVIAILVVGGVSALHAQGAPAGQHQREGFWIGFGVGAARGHIDCTPCGPLLPNDP